MLNALNLILIIQCADFVWVVCLFVCLFVAGFVIKYCCVYWCFGGKACLDRCNYIITVIEKQIEITWKVLNDNSIDELLERKNYFWMKQE